MYILGRTQMIPADTYTEAIERIMAKGFDGAEINLIGHDRRVRQEFFEDGFAARMRGVMQRCGVKACSVGAHMDYTERGQFNTVAGAIPVAKALGCDTVIITGPGRNKEALFELQWERQIRSAKELCRIAEEHGVYLAMEFEPGFVVDNTQVMLQAFAEIDSPMMRVNADIGHMFLLDPDPMEAIELCGKFIIHGHIENMQAGVHRHLVPYEEDMDLPAYIQKLRAVGFDGPMSLDLYHYDYEAVAEQSLQYLRSIL